ncbi:MAG: molybdopterin converting factor subunit 1 [Candidatus Schekmanbacteria bacterium RBG_16_38_11]|uniref:Molybdopterin synthase sulfur carrier subunit n=1 Tax=Candidatus Schekmanbacteria bacterium RBG_16_38_11 TaxID=1817880 RepID=A0A1F7RVX9_9BACT|nr:MAG: molybdopterin converting factor subunit 1 [Candidatus Schekmanbacteria bacterium RBG_16_38_11]
MKVKVKLFAVVRERMGTGELELELPEDSRLSDLMNRLKKEYEPIGSFKSSLAISINREYAKKDEFLKEGDEIALIPPVSGG